MIDPRRLALADGAAVAGILQVSPAVVAEEVRAMNYELSTCPTSTQWSQSVLGGARGREDDLRQLLWGA